MQWLLEMSYELNFKIKCVDPLLLGDVKNFLIPPRKSSNFVSNFSKLGPNLGKNINFSQKGSHLYLFSIVGIKMIICQQISEISEKTQQQPPVTRNLSSMLFTIFCNLRLMNNILRHVQEKLGVKWCFFHDFSQNATLRVKSKTKNKFYQHSTFKKCLSRTFTLLHNWLFVRMDKFEPSQLLQILFWTRYMYE